MRLPRVRFTVRQMMAVVAIAAVLCTGILQLLPESPAVRALHQKAKAHELEARRWEIWARLSEKGVTSLGSGTLCNGTSGEILAFRLSEKGVTSLGSGTLYNGTSGEILAFNHFVPRPRPSDKVAAKAFDRECASIAAKCRTMARYHDRLRSKWEHAASKPWGTITPDPPPLLPLEPSSVMDAIY